MSDAANPAVPKAPRPVQLRLLAPPRPLDERLGAEFFRKIPRHPGVYLLRDHQQRLLYVGKARDLRRRLSSYRHLTHASRKTVRLVHLVHHLSWEICSSEASALLRENELLRTHRPRFNRANTWPQGYAFLELVTKPNGITLRLVRGDPKASTTPAPESQLLGDIPRRDDSALVATRYGAFKAGVAPAFAALLRILWRALQPESKLAHLPRRLLQSRPPREFTFPWNGSPEWPARLRALLSGESADWLNQIESVHGCDTSRFEEQLAATDRDTLSHFYQHGPRRRRDFCNRLGRSELWVAAEEVDDLPHLAHLADPKVVAQPQHLGIAGAQT